jgi:competence protein ComEC
VNLRTPDRASRPAIASFVLVWMGVVCARSGWWLALALTLLGVALPRVWRKSMILGFAALVAGAIAGLLSQQRGQAFLEAVVPEGPHSALLVSATDARPARFGSMWFVARPVALQALSGGTDGGESQWLEWRGPTLVVNVPAHVDERSAVDIEVGTYVLVTGSFQSSPGRINGTVYAGKISVSRMERTAGDANPLLWAGNSIRNRVLNHLRDRGPAAALVSGFLVGAVDQLPEADLDALRLAGISHYVAVSGANVAGFLLLWFIVLGPLGVGGRRRGLLGLVGVVVFAVATRWEPSVVRASLMAGMVLAGRAIGVPIDSWSALGWSGALALLVAPDLTQSVGFQLSVLATAGIMSGGDLLPGSYPAWLRGSLGPTLAAQVAVTPLLLSAFGAVPLVSPLSNLIAAPLVSVATMLGGLGTLTGLEPLVAGAVGLAGVILDLAHVAAGFPQLGAAGLLVLVAILLAARSIRLRPWLALGAALGLVWAALGGGSVVPPAVVFLDVGQGDASLILATDGSTILVDAGPEPPLLASALRRYGVDRIDLLVVTHPHEDHVAGLVGLVGRIPIGYVWMWGTTHTGDSWETVSAQLVVGGVPIDAPTVGTVATYGDITIEVLGPMRRYDDANDQSVVLMVGAGTTTVLMTGDVEEAAQADLGSIGADVLKVPHHGGATSSLSWLAEVEPQISVVSVGDNDYGHPAPEVLDVFSSHGAVVVRTDQAGDVVIPLTGDPLRLVPAVANGPVP